MGGTLDGERTQLSTQQELVHPLLDPLEGLPLFPVLRTLSHGRIRGSGLLWKGTGRCFRVTLPPTPLFLGLASCEFTSALLR
jgi:hypothetical protein